MQTNGKSDIYKSKAWITTSIDVQPTTISVALNLLEWKQVIQLQFDVLLKNKTWNLIDLPPEAHTIGYIWIFKNKYK